MSTTSLSKMHLLSQVTASTKDDEHVGLLPVIQVTDLKHELLKKQD
jgi:hypothetical protein